jgi:SAM-dependent methyltransferase
LGSVGELHNIRRKMWDASMANHIRYIDSQSQIFDAQYVEARVCPTCECDQSQYLFRKSGGTYVKCGECEMIYTNPAFKDSVLEQYYASNHSVQSEIVSSDSPFYRGLYEMGLNQIERALGLDHKMAHSGSVLDIGCSAGGFLNIAKERGWATFGLEFNNSERELSLRNGHQVQAQELARANFGRRFSTVTLWDVFEHIKDGPRLLNESKMVLEPNGIVFIQSPSADSIAARILQEKCNMFDGLEHVNIYGRKQLEIVARRAGFDVKSYQTVIPEVGVVNNYLSFQDPYLGQTENNQNLWGLASSEEILERGLGYKFQAILKPR